MEENLLKKIAFLETKIDIVETELDNLNTLLIQCGFSEGIKTIKESAFSLILEKQERMQKYY
ncbi:MAG: hypothetical protein HZB76_00005 [Chlamydiae bacterium]|nr:hypothetical protein [Chlamydiota bacterium]